MFDTLLHFLTTYLYVSSKKSGRTKRITVEGADIKWYKRIA